MWAPFEYLSAAPGRGAIQLLCDYIVGLSGLVWYCAWEMIVHDSPSSHPTISSVEKSFIETSIAGSKDKTEVSLL